MARLTPKAPLGGAGPYGSVVPISAGSSDLPDGISAGLLITTAPATGMVFEDGGGTSRTVKFAVGQYDIRVKKVTNLDSAVAFALY